MKGGTKSVISESNSSLYDRNHLLHISMPKRKFEDFTEASQKTHGDPNRAVRTQQAQVEGLLERSQKALFRSLKVARGFERQKLGRRQKTAKAENTEADTVRLEAEVEALKVRRRACMVDILFTNIEVENLDLSNTAQTHLYRSLLRSKSIVSAPAFPQYVQSTVEAVQKQQSTPSANVQARLFNSAPVRVTMTDVIESIRAVLGIDTVSGAKKKRLRAKDYANGDNARDRGSTVDAKEEEVSMEDNGSENEPVDIVREIPLVAVDEDPKVPSHHTARRDDESEDYAIYDSRLAASDDESNNEEMEEVPIAPGPNEISPSESEQSHNLSSSSSENIHPPPPPTTKPLHPPKLPLNSTTFLPSLSIGGYWSGSESGADDPSATDIQPRRNRRGQQARRQLWEKKFGRNANHIKKQEMNRDWGSDLRRGASDGRGRGRDGDRDSGGMGKRDGGRQGGRGPMISGANSDPIKPRAKPPAVEGPLHPSWVAAKKAKEQKKAVAFKGKKVVFD